MPGSVNDCKPSSSALAAASTDQTWQSSVAGRIPLQVNPHVYATRTLLIDLSQEPA